jgi:tripartite-type tricarboxylate transporter receptor subunit TctC
MNRNRREVLKGIFASTSALAMPSIVKAQANRLVTLVVPYPPGGTSDIIGRLLAEQLGPMVGRQVIVDNRPGAGTAIGASYVARASGDGNTLLLGNVSTLSVNQWLYKKLPYDPVHDFAPIGLVAAVPLVVVVPSSMDVSKLADLVAAARANKERLNYGSAGSGSPHHLAAEMFKAAAGVDLVHVPYKGTAPAIADLLSGNVQVVFSDIAPALPHVRSGKLRALAVTSAGRQPTLAETPTVAESGIPGISSFDAVAWQCLVGPASMSREVVDSYAAALAQVMSKPSVRDNLLSKGVEPRSSNPAQLAKYIRDEAKHWGEVVKVSGVTLD